MAAEYQQAPRNVITVRSEKGGKMTYELASNARLVNDNVVADVYDAKTHELHRNTMFPVRRVVGWVFNGQVHVPHR